MFGRMNLLTDGAQVEGHVVKAWFSDPGFNNRLGVQVRVKFPDGSTEECTDRMLWVSDVGRLTEGSVVPVRFDPAKHSRLAIDVPALKERYAPVKASLEAERELASDEATGRSIRARITYREVASGETKTKTIVSVASIFDRRDGEATVTSPVGVALIGRAVGDRVMLPGGLNKPPIEVDIVGIDELET